MRKRQLEDVAVAWALAEVEEQLREEPAHRLTVLRTHSWLLIAPNKVGVSVDVVRVEGSDTATVELELSARATGVLPGHVRALQDYIGAFSDQRRGHRHEPR